MAFNSIQEFIDHCRDEVLHHGAIKKDYLRSFFEILDDKGSIEKLRGISSTFLKLQFPEFEELLKMVNFALTTKAVAVEVDGVLIMHNVADIADEEYIVTLKGDWSSDNLKLTPTLNKWDVSEQEKFAIKKAKELWESLTPDPIPAAVKVEEPKSTIVYIEIPQ
jgi:hypothetical protein